MPSNMLGLWNLAINKMAQQTYVPHGAHAGADVILDVSPPPGGYSDTGFPPPKEYPLQRPSSDTSYSQGGTDFIVMN